MRLASRTVTVALLTAGLWLLAVPAAHAYIDPGSGSYVLQMAIAGAMAAGMAVKVFWRRIVDFFSGLTRGKRQ